MIYHYIMIFLEIILTMIISVDCFADKVTCNDHFHNNRNIMIIFKITTIIMIILVGMNAWAVSG